MTIHPYLFPSLFTAGVSMAAAAILRRVVRREYSSLLPWLKVWGIICTFPALFFIVLGLPCLEETAGELRAAISEGGMELLAGAAGVLPGLLWDETDDRIEQHRALPFGLPAAAFRALLIAVLAVAILIPYGFLFSRRTSPAPGLDDVPQTEISVWSPLSQTIRAQSAHGFPSSSSMPIFSAMQVRLFSY